MEAAGSSMTTQSTSQHTPQLSPKKSPNKHAKFKQNNNNSPKRSPNHTSSASFPQNDNSISKDTILSPNRSQNDIRIPSGSFQNGPGTSAVRSPVKKPPNEVLISAIENHQNKQSIPKATQDNTASQHSVPAVDSLVITVNNATPTQRVVQNHVQPQTTVQNHVQPQTTVQNHVQPQTTSQNVSPSVQLNATSSKPQVFRFPQSRPFQFENEPQMQLQPTLRKLPTHMRYLGGVYREHLGHTKDSWRSRRHCDDDPDYFRKVIVTGFPAYTKPDELVRKLSGLGTPLIEIMKNRVAVIIFNDELEAYEAIQANDTITVYGTILSIMKYTHRRHVLDLIRANKRVIRNEIKGPPVAEPTDIDLYGDFEQQMQNIEDAIRLTQEEVNKINLLFEDVEKYMRMIYPTCEAVPFGSITTGQGIKSSDADCFLSLKPGSEGRPGAGAAELCSQFVSRAARLLRLYPEVFAQLVAIPRANTPIIKFLHVPTNVNCDLNSKTPLGVQNSRLLAHLLRCNPRFGSVALLLKYWARVQQLSGTGRLTNYALLLLLIFYLQKSFLPPVYILQSVESSFMVEGWEAGFDRAPLAVLREVPPVRDLLGGFFLFYAGFDFDDLVVCPLVGRPLRKAEFESNYLPAQYFRYRRNIKDGYALPIRTNCCLCIQDPFELSHNVASAVSCRLAAEIKAHIKLAATAYAKEKSPGDFLRIILLTRPPLTETSNEARVACRVSLPSKLLLELEDNWQDIVRDTMLNIAFKDLLFVELMRKDSVSREPGVNLEVYQGCVSRPVWRRGHNANARATPAELLMWHRQTVARIVRDAPHVPDVHVPFEVEFGFRSIPRGFTITTSPLEGADQELFRSFRQFAHTFIHRWHRELLKPHLKEPPAFDAVKNDQKPATPKKSPKKSPKKTAEKKPVNKNIATKDPPPIQSVPFANSNHKDLSDTVAAINLIDSSIISFRIDDSSKLNLKIEDDAS